MRWAVENEQTTADIGGRLGTRAVGDAIAALVRARGLHLWPFALW